MLNQVFFLPYLGCDSASPVVCRDPPHWKESTEPLTTPQSYPKTLSQDSVWLSHKEEIFICLYAQIIVLWAQYFSAAHRSMDNFNSRWLLASHLSQKLLWRNEMLGSEQLSYWGVPMHIVFCVILIHSLGSGFLITRRVLWFLRHWQGCVTLSVFHSTN